VIKKKKKSGYIGYVVKFSHVYRVVAIVVITRIEQSGGMCIANASSFGYRLFAKGLHLVIGLFTKGVHWLHKGTKRF